MDQSKARAHILRRLRTELSDDRTYHSFEHTVDVYASAIDIGEKENISDSDMVLLKTAALYHDAGFLLGHDDHEKNGCILVRQDLPAFGYSESDIARICEMIMATKIPQEPQDHLSRILCDADLDYLGRDDFGRIGDKLYLELKVDGIVKSREEWDELQIEFLREHHYFTETSKNERDASKQANLDTVIARVEARK